jgi:hypothetical protein
LAVVALEVEQMALSEAVAAILYLEQLHQLVAAQEELPQAVALRLAVRAGVITMKPAQAQVAQLTKVTRAAMEYRRFMQAVAAAVRGLLVEMQLQAHQAMEALVSRFLLQVLR